jgi:subtilase family serine protease
LTPVGSLDQTRQLNLAIGLPLRNQRALTNLLQRISDPASPEYHHYLTPAQFAEKFGPTESDYNSIIQFAHSKGFRVTATHSNRMMLDVAGSISNIAAAFHVKMRTYSHPTENRLFYAPDAEPLLPPTILHVSGLDNYLSPHPMVEKKSFETVLGDFAVGNGSGPSGEYWGNDFRAAYVPGTTLNGAGQTVGLVEFDGYYPNDVSDYLSLTGEPAIAVTNIFLDGFDGTPGLQNSEVALDIDMATCMAPGLSFIMVYEGTTPDDILNQIATDGRASQIGCAWSFPIDLVTEQIFQQFAAQGMSFFSASGDSDAWVAGIPTPCDDPNVTSVGGTTLTTGPDGGWFSETVWNWDVEYGSDYDGRGSGGGISETYSIPWWQTNVSMTGNGGSVLLRNIPDVAIAADNIFIVADNGQLENVGGTSCATVLWAGFAALANQQAAALGRAPLGFINPTIYSLGESADYTNCFHDVTTGNNAWSESPNLFFATTGYDLCTGWGAPIGTNLINFLAPDPLQISPASIVAFSGLNSRPTEAR